MRLSAYCIGSPNPSTNGSSFKRALIFELWTEQIHRPTRDVDFLGQNDNDPGRLEAIFRDLCAVSVEDDGLAFDPSTVKAQRIRERMRITRAFASRF